MPNYSYVIDSSFQPFSLQEMLVPFSAYKDAFEKSEAAYNDLSDKSDKFKYLSETLPEGSKARQLYEGYANDLRKQAEDLAHNGLTQGNRRALTSMRQRYQGEIGRLMKADEAMDIEKKLRQSLNAQDSSRLYATDNLNIDDFLDGGNPNLYNISGNELYTRGAAAGKAASARVFSAGDGGSTLGGYFRDYVQKMGYNSDTIARFRQDMSAIPELQMAADAILEERGVPQNLTGMNLQRARQSVINGMIDGAVYQEQHSPQRDLGVLDATQRVNLASQGLTYDDRTGTVSYNPSRDPALQKAAAIAAVKNNGRNRSNGSNGTAGGGTYNGAMLPKTMKIEWNGDIDYTDKYGNPSSEPEVRDGRDDDISIEEVENLKDVSGKPILYTELPRFVKKKVDALVGNSEVNNYKYIYTPYKYGMFNDTEASVIVIPGDMKKQDGGEEIDYSIQ